MMMDEVESEGNDSRWTEIKKFFISFYNSKGAISTVIVTLSMSFSLGCTVAIVPEVLSDRYARLYHGYDWTQPCSSFHGDLMPTGCQQGSDDAQDASAWSSLLQYLLTLFLNPIVGKMSDIYGRRRAFVLCMFTYTLAPMLLVAMQLLPMMEPIWYYLANSAIGAISFSSIAFATVSDVVLEKYRTASFGVIMAGFYSGFCLSPFLALLLSHIQVSILSAVLTTAAFLYTLICFSETLPDSVRERNRQEVADNNEERQETSTTIARSHPFFWGFHRILMGLTRPLREMSILNRDRVIRMVAWASFFSSMVYAADSNLVLFYIEEYLDVREEDVAYQFLAMGIAGVVLQGFLLQPLLKCFGDKGLLIIAFCSGTTHNLLYGLAREKRTLYAALCLSQLTKTNTPILASLASKDASAYEQGQLQGALYAVNALGGAIGPLCMQFIYERTKDSIGPGTMFIFASFLYFIGTTIVIFIPADEVAENSWPSPDDSTLGHEIEEPLLENSDDQD